jgi:hypothetical protein
MNWKRTVKKYGLIFGATYVGSFLALVIINSRFNIKVTVPGDIKLGQSIYFPFVSSLAIAAFATIMLEAYKVFKTG